MTSDKTIDDAFKAATTKYSFGRSSSKNMIGLHPDLIRVLHRALGYGVMDFSVISGLRTQREQNLLYEQGRSLPGPIVTWTKNSKHMKQDDGFGHAFDAVPYPVDWGNSKRFYKLSGLILAAAAEEGVELEWGGDWKNQDMPHYQKKE